MPDQLEAEREIGKRDGELPEHLKAPPPMEGALGLTADMLYNDADPPEPPKEEKKPAAEKEPEDQAGPKRAAGKPPEKPQEPEAADKGCKQAWDREKQERDQELANLRKENERLKAAAEGKTPAREKAPAKADGPADEEAEAPGKAEKPAVAPGEGGTSDGKALSDLTDEELADLQELDEFAEETDRNKVLNEIIRRENQRARREKAERLSRDEQNRQAANKKAYEALLDEGAKKYGADLLPFGLIGRARVEG